MKEKIIAILGKNHTTTIELNRSVNKVRGLYTFQNDVFVIADGDEPFDNLSEDEQKNIAEMVVNEQWTINNSLQ